MIKNKRIVFFFLLLSFLFPLSKLFDFSIYSDLLSVIGAIGAAFLVKFDESAHVRKKTFLLWSLIPLALMTIYLLIVFVFGDFDFGAVIYHLQAGMGGGRPSIRGNRIVFLTIAVAAFVLSLAYLKQHDRRFYSIDISLALMLLIANPAFWSAGQFYLSKPDPTLTDFYVDPPKQFQQGAQKKNIIIIYAESAERTFAELEHGQNSFAELLKLAASGVDVQGIRQISNTGWTMAGFLASQCGVPLQPRGLYQDNSFANHTAMLTGIRCLTDVLGANGYHTEYINGGARKFAGLGAFLGSHHFSASSGLDDYSQLAGDYIHSWGLYDDTLFELAEKRIEVLQQQGKPFAFSMATIGGHSPNGHVTRTCQNRLKQENLTDIEFALKCTGYHIESFKAHLQSKGLMKDTIFVVQSDHLMMENEHATELARKDRMNYFSFSGEDIAPTMIKREAAMFDVFPTLLQLVGMEVPGGRAGLGVSLLGAHKNLVEIYGQKKLDSLVSRDRMLSRKLWGDNRL